RHVGDIISPFQNLSQIQIIHCEAVDQNIFSALALLCGALKVLIVQNCDGLIQIAKPSGFSPFRAAKDIVFKELKVLDISQNSSLKAVELQCPKLSKLIANKCKELESLDVICPYVSDVQFRDSPNVNIFDVHK